MLNYLEKNKKLLVYTPLFIYWIILFIATTLPVESVPSIGVGDKLNHFGAYFVLSVLLFLALLFQKKFTLTLNLIAVYVLVISAVYGAADELHQMLIPGRSAEFLDWLSDVAGTFLGVIFMLSLVKKLNYRIKTAD